MRHRKRRHHDHERTELAERDHQAEQEQQVIDPVEDVEEAFPREQVERLMPARIQVDDAGVGVHVEDALGSVRLQEAQPDIDLQAEPRQPRANREVGLVRGDGVLEGDVHHALFPVDLGVLGEPRSAGDVGQRLRRRFRTIDRTGNETRVAAPGLPEALAVFVELDEIDDP